MSLRLALWLVLAVLVLAATLEAAMRGERNSS